MGTVATSQLAAGRSPWRERRHRLDGGLVVGVAGATAARGPIMTAGIAGLVAGAVSMALGSTSRSAANATPSDPCWPSSAPSSESPEDELEELAAIYVAKGASVETARRLAEELTAHDAFAAHADAELGIDPDALTNPWHAAASSAAAFTVGILLPLLAILLPPAGLRVASPLLPCFSPWR